ncbi:MAG TPA: glutamate formimidoyltransferase [Candidatus Acidoferrales bacterium]
MKRLVECVPNFAEGRDLSKVDAIVAAISEVPGVFLLARESDADHNRSVITLAGDPDSIVEAAVLAVGKASELIDLTRQTGAHPRVGATDVVPFVPLEGVSLEDCVILAKKAGREIWGRYRIPVYFYEAAAQRPDRVNLENIRRGQFEGLREEIVRNPDRAPDVGDARVHPTAGATVVGARKFLIAYNINLNTPDVAVAKKIAKTIRFSSGGLPFVKAMGVDLRARNLAQVSMNLTDFEQTPVHLVFETVKREADRHGVGIAGSEIVGLIPRRAIEMTAENYLKIENFSPAQVLENRLEESLMERGANKSLAAVVRPFLEAVAQPTATPGGGSVAALAGALAANLGQMVAGLSGTKKAAAAHKRQLDEAVIEFDGASRRLATAIDRDAESFQCVVVAYKLPHDTPDEIRQRHAAIQSALVTAIEVPLEIAREAAQLFERLGQLEPVSSPSMLSDVRVARLMASTAVRGALENVTINLESVTDTSLRERVRSECRSLTLRITESPVEAGRKNI